MNRALCFGLFVALAIGCGSNTSGGVGSDADVIGNHDGGGNGNGDGGGNGGGDGDVIHDGGSHGHGDGGGTTLDGGSDDTDGGTTLDGGSGGTDGGTTLDGGVAMDGGSGGAQQLRQYSSRSCWSWGGFGSVRPDAPAHIVAFLEDLDGIADIATSAEVFILGDAGMRYSLGQVGFTSLGDTGCCQRAAKVPITYDDFLAAAQVIDTSTMWGAEAVFRDSAGHTTTARCEDQWRLNATPIGG